MSDLRKAAEMALEALENPCKAKPEGVADAIQALRQALAQPEQEPVTLDAFELYREHTAAFSEERYQKELAQPAHESWLWRDKETGYITFEVDPKIDNMDFWEPVSYQPNIPVNTSGIADLDSYRGVTYTTPLGAAIYDVDFVKWLIDNRGADYFKSQEWQDKCARSEK